MSFRVDITTKRNPFATACTPRFETWDEAHAYGTYLLAEHRWILRVEIVECDGEPNAVFTASLAWMEP